MNFPIALTAAGGLALFLLALQMMTEGLRTFAGAGLKALPGRSLADVGRCVALTERTATAADHGAETAAALEQFQATYQEAKTGLLATVVGGRLSADATDTLLDELSATRRLLDQLVKADRLLRAPSRTGSGEQENNQETAGPDRPSTDRESAE